MPCTTILVGRKASYDGSTIIARNDDSGTGYFTPKKFAVVHPEDQPRHYRSVLSHVEVDLPDDPMRYTCMPNAVPGKGIWAAAGINAANVAMTATETITTNPRVLGADPLVEYIPARTDEAGNAVPEKAGGIGEEDLVVLTLPYIRSAREGVKRLGSLLEQYGTYEMNGIGFSDSDEIWWLETIGGHHWIARRVPDDTYVTMPNQLGIDSFDLADALGAQKEYMCSADLRDFIRENHLDLTIRAEGESADRFNPRIVFGSHTDSDHVYNTPRAWFMQRYLNPGSPRYDGPDADIKPESDEIPWCRVPEKKITIEDVKYTLSSCYQGTPFDPYASHGDRKYAGLYREIGINRNEFLGVLQIRPYLPEAIRAVEWICCGSNAFNTLIPQYTNIGHTEDYLSCTTGEVSTDSFYWASVLLGILADAHYGSCLQHIERYADTVLAKSHEILARTDRAYTAGDAMPLCEKANAELTAMLRKETEDVLGHVVFESSARIRNAYSRNDG